MIACDGAIHHHYTVKQLTAANSCTVAAELTIVELGRRYDGKFGNRPVAKLCYFSWMTTDNGNKLQTTPYYDDVDNVDGGGWGRVL